MERNKRLIAGIIVSIVVLCGLFLSIVVRSQYNNRRFAQYNLKKSLMMDLQIYYTQSWDPERLKDICSNDGTPLLSWRVNVALDNKNHVLEDTDLSPSWSDPNNLKATENPVDLSRSWSDPINLKATENPPSFCRNLVFDENWWERVRLVRQRRTCIFTIKEIREKFIKGTLRDDEKKKALFVLVEPEYAQPWMKPGDVSFVDLYCENVRLSQPIIFLDATLELRKLSKTPKTFDEWWEFCGVTPDEGATQKNKEQEQSIDLATEN